MRIATIVSTVGYHWEEIFAAYDELTKAGAIVDVFTVDGSPPRVDPVSVRHTGPLNLFGLGITKSLDPSTPRGREVQRALDLRRPLDEMVSASYDAMYLPGGHGCLFDVNRNEMVHRKVLELFNAGKVLSAVCHATSTFAFVKTAGVSIASRKALTGFPQAMDDMLIKANAVHEAFLPLPFSNENVLRREGVDVPPLDALRGSLNPRHMVVSLPFITGVGPKSARPVARAVLTVLRQRGLGRVAA